jgi:hypothetical protein
VVNVLRYRRANARIRIFMFWYELGIRHRKGRGHATTENNVHKGFQDRYTSLNGCRYLPIISCAFQSPHPGNFGRKIACRLKANPRSFNVRSPRFFAGSGRSSRTPRMTVQGVGAVVAGSSIQSKALQRSLPHIRLSGTLSRRYIARRGACAMLSAIRGERRPPWWVRRCQVK